MPQARSGERGETGGALRRRRARTATSLTLAGLAVVVASSIGGEPRVLAAAPPPLGTSASAFASSPPVSASNPSRCEGVGLRQDPPDGTPLASLDGAKHFSYTTFAFPGTEAEVVRSVELDVTLCNVPDERPYGLYFQIYMEIGSNPLYFGFQTDLARPGVGWVGQGFIFSRWGPTRRDDLRTNPSGGFFELGTHEGEFVGVRLPHRLAATTYHLKLRNRGDRWYQLEIQADGAAPVDVGWLRLAGDTGIRSFTLTAEAYALRAVPADDIPVWQVRTSIPRVNGVAAQRASIRYPTAAYPFGGVTLHTDRAGAPFLQIVYGGRTSRRGAENGSLPIPP